MTDLQTDREKTFRLNNQKILLTYKTHLNKQEYIIWIKDKFNNYNIKWIRLAHETGSKEIEYEHTHVLIDFGKAFQSRNCRIFDYLEIHPNIKLVKNKKHWDDAVKYIGKEDPDNEDLQDTPLITKITDCKNLSEALETYVKKPCDYFGVKAMYEDNKIIKNTFDIILYPWQQEIFNITQQEPNNRHIYWIYDSAGNSGKSHLIKYCKINYPEEYYSLKNPVSERNAATTLECLEHKNIKTIFIDISRTFQDKEYGLYSIMENIKDGEFTSQKYKGKTYNFRIPHLIIFSNWKPIVNKITWDRWIIYELNNMTLRKMNLSEI